MNSLPTKIAATLGASALLVMGVDAASYAATGNSLILGHINQANQTTTVKKVGPGAALRLVTGPSSPPLAVTSKRRVDNLNADKVDGFDGQQLRTKPTIYRDVDGTTNHGGLDFWPIALSKGTHQISWSAALNPTAGSVASPTTTVCGIIQNGNYRGLDMAPYIGNFGQMFLSGSDTVSLASAGSVNFFCQVTQGSYTLDQGIRVNVVKTNGAAPANLTSKAKTVNASPLGR